MGFISVDLLVHGCKCCWQVDIVHLTLCWNYVCFLLACRTPGNVSLPASLLLVRKNAVESVNMSWALDWEFREGVFVWAHFFPGEVVGNSTYVFLTICTVFLRSGIKKIFRLHKQLLTLHRIITRFVSSNATAVPRAVFPMTFCCWTTHHWNLILHPSPKRCNIRFLTEQLHFLIKSNTYAGCVLWCFLIVIFTFLDKDKRQLFFSTFVKVFQALFYLLQ